MKKAMPVLLLLGIAAFCGYGFATTYELTDDAVAWRATYGIVGAVALLVAARMLQKEEGS